MLIVSGLVAMIFSGSGARTGHDPNWTGLSFGFFAALLGIVLGRLGVYLFPKDKR